METKDDLMDVLEYYMDNKSNFSNMLGKDILELYDYQKSTIEPQLNNTPIIHPSTFLFVVSVILLVCCLIGVQ